MRHALMRSITWKIVVLATLVGTAAGALGDDRSTSTREPLLRDGGFEKTGAARNRSSDWYFVRQGSIETDEHAPEGRRVIRFQNETPGRDAQAQQLIRIDGREVRGLHVSVRVRGQRIAPGQSGDQAAQVKLIFFDERHQRLGEQALGPWLGTFPWKQEQARLDVPPAARMALVYIGLLGGTGQVALDDLQIRPAAENPSVLPAKRLP